MCETFHLVCRVIVRRHSLIGPVASTDVKWRAALLRTEPFAHWAIHSDELPLLSSPTVDPSVVKWNTCGQLHAFLLLLLLCLSHFNSHFTKKKKKKSTGGTFFSPVASYQQFVLGVSVPTAVRFDSFVRLCLRLVWVSVGLLLGSIPSLSFAYWSASKFPRENPQCRVCAVSFQKLSVFVHIQG